MKFVCNNCGFTADIPEQMSACPMCGSSNVSSAAEISKFSADSEEEIEDENAKAQNFKAAAGPTQRVTLTEGMNVEEKSDPKAVVRSEKKTREIGRKSKVPLVVILLVLVVAAAAAAGFFFLFK